VADHRAGLVDLPGQPNSRARTLILARWSGSAGRTCD
jgi:hypothetical protein